jgi:hypothetical protein
LRKTKKVRYNKNRKASPHKPINAINTEKCVNNIGLVEKIKKHKAFIFACLIISLLNYAYPYVMDYKDGKWGGEIKLKLGSAELREKEPTYLFYPIPEGAREAKFMLPVQLSVHNQSKKADKNIRMSLAYDKSSKRSVIPEGFMTYSGRGFKSDVMHELNSTNSHDYSNYQVEFLPVDGSRGITDGAFTSKMVLGNDFFIPFSTGTGLDVNVITYSENDTEREWFIRYRGVDVIDSKGLELWVRNWYGKQIAIEIRRESGFWNYLFGLFWTKNIVIYGLSPEFQYIENYNLYIPKEDLKNYTGFEFNPYVWSLLLDFD